MGGAKAGILSGAFSKVGTAAGKVGGALSHAGNQLRGLLTGPLGMIGLAGGLYGVEQAFTKSVGSAMDFQAAMELIATQAGGTQAEVNSMTKAVLDMAASVGTGPNELAAGLYHIESAGLRGAKALEILKVAAQGAKVGNADLESVTNALIAATNSGIKGVTDMAGAMGSLNAIVGAGNMRMQDLADAFSTGILSTAKTFGLSIQSIGAAIADMTNQGVPAIDAATRLRMSINLLGAPTSKAAKLFKDIGLGALDLAKTMRGPGGISAAIGELAAHMRKAGMIDAAGNVNTKGADFLSQAFGGGRSSSAIMTLVGSMGKLATIQAQVNKGAGAFGDAWAKTQQDAQFKMERFQAVLGTIGIKVANSLLPSITDAFTTLGDWLDTHQNDVVSFFSGLADGAKAAFGTVAQIAGAIGSAWGSIPAPLREFLVKGLVADRTIKFLFGFSPIGALMSGIQNALMKSVSGGIVSAGLGKMFVQPVFVTNMMPGFGGGVPGLPGAAATGGSGLLSLLGGAGASVLSVAVLAISAVALAAMADSIQSALGTGYDPAKNLPLDQMSWPWGPKNTPIIDLGPFKNILGGDSSLPGVPGRDTDKLGNSAVGATRDRGWEVDNLAGMKLIVHALDALHLDFQKQLAALKTATDPAKVMAAAKGVLRDIQKGVGSVHTTGDVLATLRRQLANTHDPKLQAVLRDAIAKVEHKLAARRVVEDQLKKAQEIAASSKTTDRKLADLKAIENKLRAEGAIHAAQQVAKLERIARKKSSFTAITKVNVDVSTSVSVRDTVRRTTVASRYGGNGTYWQQAI